MRDEKKIYRVIDANLNRAREGLRVVEDFARFVLDDAALSSDIKIARHNLDKISRVAYPRLVSSRDSGGDVFRKTRESAKKDMNSVVVSNIKRAEESLRTLEEFSKMISASAGSGFKKIRFRIYDIEKNIAEKTARQRRRSPKGNKK